MRFIESVLMHFIQPQRSHGQGLLETPPNTVTTNKIRSAFGEKGRAIYKDCLIGLVLACIVFFGAFRIAQSIDPVVFEYGASQPGDPGLRTTNIWFEGDLPKMYVLLEQRTASYPEFTQKHPLIWPAGYAPVFALRKSGLLDYRSAVNAFTAAIAAIWTFVCFCVLRAITGRRFDATLFTILALASASSVFWLIVPEVFVPGSLTILVALGVAALVDYLVVPAAFYVIASGLTLSVTVTNWMAGLLAPFITQHWKRALQISVNACFIVSLLWGLQKPFFPSSQYFLTVGESERQYILHPQSGGPVRVINAFLFHTMVMPRVETRSQQNPTWYRMTIQHSAPGSGGAWGQVSVALWLALLGIGIYGLITAKRQRALRVLLASTILLQLTLHIVYGWETFLYAMHFAPLLIAMAAIGTLTRLRKLTLILVGILVITAGINNGLQLTRAIDIVSGLGRIAHP